MGRALDTSAGARERQLELYRAMTPEDRLRLADELSTAVRSLARSGVAARNLESDPNASAPVRRPARRR